MQPSHFVNAVSITLLVYSQYIIRYVILIVYIFKLIK